eukprot:TRINITY_DN45476_c0_g1_i1.p1 TRINITY_DN45476_c0_g1~~TRINITY_DN45476_c0_g1_i1.p1  ORF type:complete len:495 (+),score=56.51 TRINITY_DN45476_c0_g1_i1:213-1697(+)
MTLAGCSIARWHGGAPGIKNDVANGAPVTFRQYSGALLGTYPTGPWAPLEGQANWHAALLRASAQIRDCLDLAGGRYWAVRLWVPRNQSSTGGNRVRRRMQLRTISKMNATVPLVGQIGASFGVCVPVSCTQAAVRALTLPAIRSLGFLSPGPLQTIIDRGALWRADELTGWGSLGLDWVVLGAAGCGTSTLVKSLQAHPELEAVFVEHLYYEENAYLLSREHHPLHLPFKSEVDRFTALHTKDASPQSTRPSRLRGVKYGDYILSDVALARLSEMRGVKAIVLLEDPVQLAEVQWLKNNAWCHALARKRRVKYSFTSVDFHICIKGESCAPFCAPNASDDFKRRGFKLRLYQHHIANRVEKAVAALGAENIFLIDRQSLFSAELGDSSGNGRPLFDAMARFIGVGSFPADVVLPASSNTGHGSPGRRPTSKLRAEFIVSRPDAVATYFEGINALKEHFGEERRSLRRLFAALPPRRPREKWPRWLREGEAQDD